MINCSDYIYNAIHCHKADILSCGKYELYVQEWIITIGIFCIVKSFCCHLDWLLRFSLSSLWTMIALGCEVSEGEKEKIMHIIED